MDYVNNSWKPYTTPTKELLKLARARNHAYWPGIAHDVLQLCHECEICAEDYANLGIPNIHHADACRPGFKYVADIGEIDGHPHLIFIDYYSFTVFEWPLPSLAMSSVITAFKTIFSDTGTPLTLVTDNALCFTSEEFSDFAKSWNFNHTTSSPRYPKGNAHAEWAVGMVKQIYNRCEDPLFGMLILKTVPLLDVKESPVTGPNSGLALEMHVEAAPWVYDAGSYLCNSIQQPITLKVLGAGCWSSFTKRRLHWLVWLDAQCLSGTPRDSTRTWGVGLGFDLHQERAVFWEYRPPCHRHKVRIDTQGLGI